jgi:hypothetical protein
VEEARQHPAVSSDSFTADEIGLTIVGGLGGVAVLAGIVFQVIVGGRSILLGFLAFALSRALTRLWQFARPHAFPRHRVSRRLTLTFAAFWAFLSLCLSVPYWGIF